MPAKMTIKEVKEQLQKMNDGTDTFVEACRTDERMGVQTALRQWQRQQDAQQDLVDRFERMSQYEMAAKSKGYQFIAGIDEVGRGPLAGPVVAAAVILDETKPIIGLDDSKKLSLKRRTKLYEEIKETAVAVGIGIIDSEGIDRYNILGATKLAMQQAVDHLEPEADFLLVDAVHLANDLPAIVMNQGDSKSNSIAAASIIAKVTRDLMMIAYDQQYPGYGFAQNAGYGTKEHLEGIKSQGITPIHRHSFAPVRKYS